MDEINVPAGTQAKTGVSVKLHQGLDANVSVKFAGAKKYDLGMFGLGCLPRNPIGSADPVIFPAAFTERFSEINSKLMKWMNEKDNAHLFFASPVEAMKAAGIELSRADQKLLSRNFLEQSAHTTIAPGMNIKSLSVETIKGAITPPKDQADSPRPAAEKDCGCSDKKH